MATNILWMRFCYWLQENYPDVQLLPWQEEVAKQIVCQPLRAGKTFILSLLSEYDSAVSPSPKGEKL